MNLYFKRKLVFTLALLFCIIGWNNISAQDKDKHVKDFELELIKFRYSLYSDLDTIKDFNNISNFISGSVHYKTINTKIDVFLKGNEKEISDYKISCLEKYYNMPLDLSMYNPDSVFNAQHDDLSMYDTLIHQIGNTAQLLYMNPIENAIMHLNIYNAKYYSVTNFAEMKLKDMIAHVIIKTNKLSENSWEIYFDHYRIIYKLIYNLKSDSIRLVAIYNRE